MMMDAAPVWEALAVKLMDALLVPPVKAGAVSDRVPRPDGVTLRVGVNVNPPATFSFSTKFPAASSRAGSTVMGVMVDWNAVKEPPMPPFTESTNPEWPIVTLAVPLVYPAATALAVMVTGPAEVPTACAYVLTDVVPALI